MESRSDRSARGGSEDERGQSAVIGMVLLLGFTVVVGSTVAFAGISMLQSGQESTQHQHAENEMAVLASKIAEVGLGDASMQQTTLSVDEGEYEVREDAGTMTIEHVDPNGTVEEIHTVTLGAVVYQNGDAEVAYQGGGVWSKRGESTSMVSPPEFHYQDETLTLPMMTVEGDSRVTGSADAVIRPGSPTSTKIVYPDAEAGYENPVENGTIRVTVESDYHQGWEQYFDERTAEEPYSRGENRVAVDLETRRDLDKAYLDGGGDSIPLPPDVGSLDEFTLNATPYDDGGNLNQLDWDLTGEYENGTETEIVHLEGFTDAGERYVTVTMGEWEYVEHVEGGFDGPVVINFVKDDEMTWTGEGEREPQTLREVFYNQTEGIQTDLEVNDNRPGQHDSFDYSDGSTYIDVDYEIGADEIKYLHITENTVSVELS